MTHTLLYINGTQQLYLKVILYYTLLEAKRHIEGGKQAGGGAKPLASIILGQQTKKAAIVLVNTCNQ